MNAQHVPALPIGVSSELRYHVAQTEPAAQAPPAADGRTSYQFIRAGTQRPESRGLDVDGPRFSRTPPTKAFDKDTGEGEGRRHSAMVAENSSPRQTQRPTHSGGVVNEGGGQRPTRIGKAEANAPPPTKKSYFDCERGEAPPTRDGHHEFKFRSGAVYLGQWLHGQRDGMGKQSWPDGASYVGEWHRGRAHGKGRFSHGGHGDVYTGQWVNGCAHGHGVLSFMHNACIYAGEFNTDQRHGYGEERWIEGSYFAGQYIEGMKSGYGTNSWPDDTAYFAGCWKDNELCGPGRIEVPNGPAYEGQWEHSCPHGMGRYKFADGAVYEGRYKQDQKHGFGVLTEGNGQERKAKRGIWHSGQLQEQAPSETE